MNNRKTARASQHAANPRGEKEKRQRQPKANELYANFILAGNSTCRG
jgi:hypothetical protein